MTTTGAENPFQASAHGGRGGAPIPASVWRSFMIRRGIRLFVLPTMLGLLTAVARQELGLPAWSIAAASLGSAALWVPTSVWMGWARFLRPPDDPSGLLIATGEVLDRAAFMHLVRARAVEVGIVLVAMWGMAGLFLVALGWLWALPVMLTCIVVTAWGSLRLRSQACIAQAAVHLASGRSREADAAVRRGLRLRAGRRTADTLTALGVVAKLRLGERQAALDALDRLIDPAWMNMDVVAASLALEDGTGPPVDLLEEVAHSSSMVRLLSLSQLSALHALYDERPADTLREIASWAPLRTWMPRQQQTSLDLLAAAGHAAEGDQVRAREALFRTQMQPEEWRWIAASHPRWGGFLDTIEEVR